MRIIELLNKIANGEEVPKRIKYKDEIRDYNDKDKDYTCSNSKNYFLFFNILRKNIGEEFKKALNDEVEILEEKKLPEKIKSNGKEFYCDNIDSWIDKEKTNAYCEYLMNKYNDLIDYLESKEKGE